MLLALLADTHDNHMDTQAALRLLATHKPDAYLHAGDLVSPAMLGLFAGLPFHFVFGNNEFDHATLRAKAKALNLTCHDHVAQLTFGSKRIAIIHGHDHALLQTLSTATPSFDYIISGHTHVRRDLRINATRHINPGALHRTKSKSVALLHLPTDILTFLEIPSLTQERP